MGRVLGQRGPWQGGQKGVTGSWVAPWCVGGGTTVGEAYNNDHICMHGPAGDRSDGFARWL